MITSSRSLLLGLALLASFPTAHAAEPAPAAIPATAKSRFVTALEAGQPRHLVVFGTSLSKSGGWVSQLKTVLDARYPGLVTITNGAKGGQNSEWGAANVGTNVIAHRPDTVLIEFAINDAVTRFDLSLDQVRKNVDSIIDQISTALPECEIILQIMNPAVGKAPDDRSARRDQPAYEQIYRDVAAKRGLLLIDHSIAWNKLLTEEGEEGFKKYVPDGIHPRPDGCARFVTPTILRVLGLPEQK